MVMEIFADQAGVGQEDGGAEGMGGQGNVGAEGTEALPTQRQQVHESGVRKGTPCSVFTD